MGTVLAFYTHPERSMIYPSPKKRNPRVRALHSTKRKLPCLTGCFGCRSTLRGLAISRPGHQIHSIDVGHFDGFLSWWVVGIYKLTSKSSKIITKYSQIIMKSLTQHVSLTQGLTAWVFILRSTDPCLGCVLAQLRWCPQRSIPFLLLFFSKRTSN